MLPGHLHFSRKARRRPLHPQVSPPIRWMRLSLRHCLFACLVCRCWLGKGEHGSAWPARRASCPSSWPIVPSLSPASASHRPISRSEEHTSELQSLIRISYAVFCLTKNKDSTQTVGVTYERVQGI